MDEQQDPVDTASSAPTRSWRFVPGPWVREVLTVSISVIALIASILASRAATRRQDDQTEREQLTRFRDLIADMADTMSEVSATMPAGAPAAEPADARSAAPSAIEQRLPTNRLALNRVMLQASEAAALLDRIGDEIAPQELAFLGSSLTTLSRPRQGKDVLTMALRRSSAAEDRVFIHRSLGSAEFFLGDIPSGRASFEQAIRLATPDAMGARLVAIEARWLSYSQWATAELYYNDDCPGLRRVVETFRDDDEVVQYFPAAVGQYEDAAEQKCG